jgi:hypothetical protein
MLVASHVIAMALIIISCISAICSLTCIHAEPWHTLHPHLTQGFMGMTMFKKLLLFLLSHNHIPKGVWAV